MSAKLTRVESRSSLSPEFSKGSTPSSSPWSLDDESSSFAAPGVWTMYHNESCLSVAADITKEMEEIVDNGNSTDETDKIAATEVMLDSLVNRSQCTTPLDMNLFLLYKTISFPLTFKRRLHLFPWRPRCSHVWGIPTSPMRNFPVPLQ